MIMKKILRYCGLAVAILFLFWIIGIVAVYFFVNVEDIKKFAVKTVNQNTTGELGLGEIKLKVFPLVHFEIKDISFKSSPNFDKVDMFSCKDSKLSFNLFTLIIGKPSITLRLDNPSVNFISDGKTNNISDAFKTEKKKSSPDALTYLFISKFKFKINNASLKYKTPKDSYELNGLDMSLNVDPVSRDVDLKMSTPVDYKKVETVIKGDLSLNASINVSSKERADIVFDLDATKLLISTKSMEKKKGAALKIKATAQSDLKTDIKINDLTVILIDELLKASGDITITEPRKISLKMDISNNYDLSNFVKLFKALSDYKMSGKLKGAVSIAGILPSEGTNNKLNIKGEIDATDALVLGTSFAKEKNVPLKLSLDTDTDLKSIDIKTLKLSSLLTAEIKGAISDFSSEKPIYDITLDVPQFSVKSLAKLLPNILSKYPVSGSVSSNAKISGSMSPLPLINLNLKYNDDASKNNLSFKASNTGKSRNMLAVDIASNYIDLSPYLPATDKTKKTKTAKGSKKSVATDADNLDETSSVKSDEDMVVVKKETIETLKKSLNDYSIKLNAKIDKLIKGDLVINNFVLDGLFSKQELSINKMNLSLLKGDISGALKIGLDVNNPKYNGKLDIKGVKVKDAADVFMPGVKGVLDGVVSSNLEFTASGYSMKPIKQNMVAKGTFSINNFAYSAQELNKLINDNLKEKLGNLAPASDKKILGTNPGWETVQGTYNVKDGKINVEQFLAKQGEYDATGKGELTFNESMDMFFDVSVPYKNIPYEGLKVDGKDKSKLSLHLTGPILKPKFDAGYFIKYVTDRALDYETKKLKQAAKSRLDTAAKNATAPVQQKANDQLKQVGEDLKKAFKGFKF